MADRRTDDTPLAPRRPLGSSGSSGSGERGTGPAQGVRNVGGRITERVSEAVTAATDTVRSAAAETRRPSERRTSGPARRPAGGSQRRTGRIRKARLRVTHVDPWSVMKTAFLLSIAIGVVTVIAVAVVWSVLGAAGVWESINKTVQEVIGGESGSAFDVENYVGMSRVLGFTMIVAVVDVVLITAIATLGAFLYNLSASLLGGIEVTLAEDES